MNKPYAFNVNTEEDPEIAAYLDNIPKGQLSAFIRDAIRCQMAKQPDLSNKDLLDLLLAAISEIAVAPAVAALDGHKENPEVIDALGKLGEW